MKAMMLSWNTGASNWTELKTFFSMRTVRQWHRLPRVVLQSPPSEMFNIWLDKAFSSLVWRAWYDHMATTVLNRGHSQPQLLCDLHESQGMLELVWLWMKQICYLSPGSRRWGILYIMSANERQYFQPLKTHEREIPSYYTLFINNYQIGNARNFITSDCVYPSSYIQSIFLCIYICEYAKIAWEIYPTQKLLCTECLRWCCLHFLADSTVRRVKYFRSF